MSFLDSLKTLFGEQAVDAITRGANNTWKEAKSGIDDFIYKSRVNMADEIPHTERQADNIETVSSNILRANEHDRSTITNDLNKLFAPLRKEEQEAFGRYLHKVGAEGAVIDDYLQGGLSSKQTEERLSRLFDSDYFYGTGDGLHRLDDVGRWMNDEATMDRKIFDSYRNSDAFIDDKIKPLFDGFNNDPTSPSYMRATREMEQFIKDLDFDGIDDFKSAYDNYLRAKAFNYFDEADKRLIERAFKDGTTRPILDEALGVLRREIDSVDDIKPRDRLLNYTRRAYDTDRHPIITTLDEAKQMESLSAGKIIGELDIGGKKMARVVPIINMEKQNVQGSLRVHGKHARGVESDLSKYNIQADGKAFDDLKKNNLTVDTFVVKRQPWEDPNKPLEHVSAELVRQKYRQQRAAYNEYLQKVKEFQKAKRPKSAEEFYRFTKDRGYVPANLINDQLSRPTNHAGILNAARRNLDPTKYPHGVKARKRAMDRDKEILDAIEDFLDAIEDFLRKNSNNLIDMQPLRPVPEPTLSDYMIGKVSRPMSDAEQVAKGRIDSPSVVIANTIAAIRGQNRSKLLNRVVEDNTLHVQNGAPNISDEFGKQPLLIKVANHKYDPIEMKWHTYFDSNEAADRSAAWMQKNKDMLEKYYIPVQRENVGTKVDVDYVHKQYAHEMLGFEQWKATEGMSWQAQMLETFGEKGIQFIRENISIKNPAVLVNNMTAGVFMQISDGVPLKLAFRNTAEAFSELRQFHEIKAEMVRLEIKHGEIMMKEAFKEAMVFSPDGRMILKFPEGMNNIPPQDILRYAELRALREKNIVFRADQDGVLKSFLDEGLWDRIIRENPNEDPMTTIMKNIFLTEDSKWGVGIRKWHDYTDMVNRIAMYKYYHTQATPEQLAKMKLNSPQDIKMRIDQMFVNYSRLLPPMVAALRRGGAIPFASWFYRAPSFLVKQIKQHPVRFATMLAAYEGTQMYLNGEEEVDLMHTGFEDKYVGAVHMDSKFSQNVLRPGNWGDGFSQLGFDPSTYLPSYMEKIASGDPLRAIGITTRENY
jgi:hypothetical protein